MTRHAGRRDEGVSIVEAAFVLPLLFMFMFGLVDLGMWTFNSNQASNAARDGARAGILAYPLLGTTAESAEASIVSAIQDHLPEGTVDASDVTIKCLTSDGSPMATCNGNGPDRPERVKVDVEWHWELVTPIAMTIGVDEGVARGSATMEIVGRPVPGGGA